MAFLAKPGVRSMRPWTWADAACPVVPPCSVYSTHTAGIPHDDRSLPPPDRLDVFFNGEGWVAAVNNDTVRNKHFPCGGPTNAIAQVQRRRRFPPKLDQAILAQVGLHPCNTLSWP